MNPTASRCLASADALINGPRADSYGPVEYNHDRIAAMWNAWLSIRREPADPLTAHDALIMMMLMKMARTQGGVDALDNYTDGVGYIALAAEVVFGQPLP